MPFDIELNDHDDFDLDGANDIPLISGVDQLEQKYRIDVKDELQDFIAGRLTGSEVGQLEERIASGLDDDPAVASVDSVTVDTFDRDQGIVNVSVHVISNDDFTMQMEVDT